MKVPPKLKYILGSALLLFLAFGFVKSGFEVLKSSKRLEETSTEVLDLKDERARLEEEIGYKKTEEYIEEKARDDLNLIKPGESIYVVKKEKDKTESNVLSETVTKLDPYYKDKNWYMWYKLFF